MQKFFYANFSSRYPSIQVGHTAQDIGFPHLLYLFVFKLARVKEKS